MKRLIPLAYFFFTCLLVLSACLPLPPVNPVPLVAAASVAVSHGSAQSPAGGEIGTLLSQTLPPSNVKALRISAWGSSTGQGNPRAFYLYVGNDLTIAVNIEAPLRWFRCETEAIKAAPDKAVYSSVCFVGDLAGATVTSVHSIEGPLNWAAPIVIRGAGKGVLLGDVTQTGMIVETLN